MEIYSARAGRPQDVELMRRHGIRLMMGAYHWQSPPRGLPYALDNGAFTAWKRGQPFDEARFMVAALKASRLPRRPDFGVVPDKVAGGLESLRFSLAWRDRLRPYDWPWYLAVQDGMGPEHVAPWLEARAFDGVFVGGTRPWKYRTAATWLALARRHGVRLHVGGVGCPRRVLWARAIGADSIDSSTWARNRSLPRLLARLKQRNLVDI